MRTSYYQHSVAIDFFFAGELTAYCMGPTRVAHCELEDHQDGTFRLVVRPQEAGRHVLQVKYGGEHVTGKDIQLVTFV